MKKTRQNFSSELLGRAQTVVDDLLRRCGCGTDGQGQAGSCGGQVKRDGGHNAEFRPPALVLRQR